MILTVEKAKERRAAGVEAMTAAEKIHRNLTGGKPPASEMRTPQAAITAARILHETLERKITDSGLDPQPGDWAVSIGYVPTDHSFVSFTPLYAKGAEESLARHLDGRIPLGLVFGIVDKKATDENERIVMGARPFLRTAQVEEWLSELIIPVRLEMED